jgi:hypothetical protein
LRRRMPAETAVKPIYAGFRTLASSRTINTRATKGYRTGQSKNLLRRAGVIMIKPVFSFARRDLVK